MSAVPYNNSSGAYSKLPAMGLPRSTVLLSRVFSHCRCDLCTLQVRQCIESSIYEPVEPLMIPMLSTDFGWWNVRLPSKMVEPAIQFTNYTEYICVDEDVMSFLEEKKVINWCPGLRQLHPIRTTGDGNCLMHAVILATCGIQDSGLVLRRLVYVALVQSASNSFRKRWEKEKQRLNENIPGGLQYTSEEWDKEWSMVVNAAEDLRKTTMAYEFLEEMHVFVLANVICRPIIILGESTVRSPLAGDSIEQNNFVGIYLPLLWDPKFCEPNPVVLCFLHNHFQPLISRYKFPSEPRDILAIPLVTSRLEPLHIHFLLPDEESKAHDLLQHYLYTSEVPRKSEDGSSVEAILVAEICYTRRYQNWEDSDYVLLTKSAQMDVHKIAKVPSKSSLNYIQPAKGDCPVLQTSSGVNQPKRSALGCHHCIERHQKSTMTQLGSSVGSLENSVRNKDTSKIQFDRLKGYPDQSQIYPDRPKSQADHATIHQGHSTDNAMIFNALKKLKSPQQEEGATRRESYLVEELMPSGTFEQGRQHGAVGGGHGWGNTGYGFKSKMETQFTPSGYETRTVGPRTPGSKSTKPGNSKSSVAGNQNQTQRKLSDISDADIEYIQQKFTLKTPIYCRSLALLGKQCAKPDCNRFVEEETDFCCLVHAHPSLPPNVVAKPRTLCTLAGCTNLGIERYSGMCAMCFLCWKWIDEVEQILQLQHGYEGNASNRGTKSPSIHPEPHEASISIMEPKVKCITDGCNRHQYTNLLGMCQRCYVQACTTPFTTSKSSVPPGKMKAERAVEQLNQVKCITEGCKGFDYSAYSGLCPKCYIQAYFGVHDTPEGSEHKKDPGTKTSVDSAMNELQQSVMSFFHKVSTIYQYSMLSDKFGPAFDRQTKCLLIQPPTSESDKYLESGTQKAPPQGNMQPPTSVATEEIERGRIHRVYENSDSRAIKENFDDWFAKKYSPKVLGGDTFPSEPLISRILPFRNKSVEQDEEEVEKKATNDCTKNEESFRGGDKQLANVGKDDGESSSPKNMLERSTSKGKVKASKEDLGDDLSSLKAVETLRPSTGSENYGELASDGFGPMDSALPCLPESCKGLWKLPSRAPDLVASGDECSDGEEFPKCLSATCEHIAMDTVAGGYCVTCHATRSLGYTNDQTSGVAEGVSNQQIKKPTQETVVSCVVEGCCNSVVIPEFLLCSACYARQLKSSTKSGHFRHALYHKGQRNIENFVDFFRTYSEGHALPQTLLRSLRRPGLRRLLQSMRYTERSDGN